jgi:hypothetical protein
MDHLSQKAEFARPCVEHGKPAPEKDPQNPFKKKRRIRRLVKQ